MMNNANKPVSVLNTPIINKIVDKLDGDNIVTIIKVFFLAGTCCYVCIKGGSLEITDGEKRIILNNTKKIA